MHSYSSTGWEEWDVHGCPLIPKGMPVLLDDARRPKGLDGLGEPGQLPDRQAPDRRQLASVGGPGLLCFDRQGRPDGVDQIERVGQQRARWIFGANQPRASWPS